ncbi:hypothetical protein [Streptomyces bullii]|uniref:DUF4190 domain-containing protein n=1 Tax=Streptomyces bullii TaxID=349910 RepID=A0ABW0UKG8_9ACTN
MSSAPACDETRERPGLAVWCGGASLACWICCPLWALVAFLALPLGLTGLTRAWLEYRSSADGRTSRPRAVTGAALSLLGTAAAVAYLVFLGTHPHLPVQE